MPEPSIVLLLFVVGVGFIFQQTPLEVIVAFPFSEIIPPDTELVSLIDVTAFVLILGIGQSFQSRKRHFISISNSISDSISSNKIICIRR